MTFAELRAATLRLSWGDRWRLWWSLGRSLLGALLPGQQEQLNDEDSAPGLANHLSTIHPSWPAEFAQKTAGQWQGEPLIRPSQEAADHRDAINW